MFKELAPIARFNGKAVHRLQWHSVGDKPGRWLLSTCCSTPREARSYWRRDAASRCTRPRQAHGATAFGHDRYRRIGIGIGIEPEQQRIFEPFAQTDASTTRRFGGTGLGLSIVHQLVEMVGGTFALHSMSGQGSTFSVTLALELPTVADPC
jgi:hypothetical protein